MNLALNDPYLTDKQKIQREMVLERQDIISYFSNIGKGFRLSREWQSKLLVVSSTAASD